MEYMDFQENTILKLFHETKKKFFGFLHATNKGSKCQNLENY